MPKILVTTSMRFHRERVEAGTVLEVSEAEARFLTGPAGKATRVDPAAPVGPMRAQGNPIVAGMQTPAAPAPVKREKASKGDLGKKGEPS